MLCLALGLLVTSSGSALAASGLTPNQTAVQAQYAGLDDSGVQQEQVQGGDPSDDPADDPARQVHAVQSSGKLPFTGFAAYLVLGLGVALLLTGAVLRHRTARSDA